VARLVRLVFKDRLEISDHRELQGREDSQDHEGRQGQLDSQAHLDQTENSDHQARPDLKARRDQLGRREARAVLALKDQQDHREILELRANRAIKVHRATPGNRVHKGRGEIQALEVPLDLLVTQASKDLMETLDQQGSQDLRDRLVL
jgi:hypothetical protein